MPHISAAPPIPQQLVMQHVSAAPPPPPAQLRCCMAATHPWSMTSSSSSYTMTKLSRSDSSSTSCGHQQSPTHRLRN
eukprot:199091-Chlamydomonas_euryale.AAC.4